MVNGQQKGLVKEVGVVTAVLVATTALLNSFQTIPFVAKFFGLFFAFSFLVVPIAVIYRRGRGIDFLDRDYKTCFKSLKVFAITALIVFPLFLLAAHGWEKIVYGAEGPVFAAIPGFWKNLAYQFIMIALPEEFFFRGYMQSTLNKVFPRNWRIFGTNLGWAWIITALIFAFSHSVVVLRWWHFAIFFPALLFGYLREKTGSITASIAFHGTSNIIMNCIAYMYR